MKHFKNDPHVLKHWQKQLISMMIVVKHYKTDLLLWNTDKTTCTLENTTENKSLSSVWHYRVVLEISREYFLTIHWFHIWEEYEYLAFVCSLEIKSHIKMNQQSSVKSYNRMFGIDIDMGS